MIFPFWSIIILINILFHVDVRPGHHPAKDFVYKMTALPRRIALIINNELFVDNTEHGRQTPRHGSEDVRQVKEMFSALGFEVHIRENRTKTEMLNEVDFFCIRKGPQ